MSFLPEVYRWPLLLLAAFLLGVLAAGAQTLAPKADCASLAKLELPQTTITMAQLVEAGAFEYPQTVDRPGPGGGFGPSMPVDAKSLPAFCRVAATLTPSADSKIRIELWLPTLSWNGRFLGLGNGGMGGSIVYSGGMAIGLAEAVKLGYAAVNTNVGHDTAQEKEDGEFLLGHPEKLVDYGYRANHEMTVRGKALVEAFYGVKPRRSIFWGCSLGSQEAMSEARRYPDDYDGVIAGAVMNRVATFNAAQIWPSVLLARDPAKALTHAKISALHAAVIARCGTEADRKLGYLSEPDACRFNVKTMLCKAGEDKDDCLTPKQAELVRQIYQGPINPRTGKVVFPGPAYGAEGQFGMVTERSPHKASLGLYSYGVMGDPNWDWRTMNFDSDVRRAEQALGPYMHTDARLNGFFDRGGKLLLYIGWEDYHNPLETVAYYKQIARVAGPRRSAQLRLFLAPGMGHCLGGDGCSVFDKLAAMERWLDTGRAPEEMLATKTQGGKDVMSRPLCAYPKVSRYKGSGDPTEAASYACVAPRMQEHP